MTGTFLFLLRRIRDFLAFVGFISIVGGGFLVYHKYGISSPWLLRARLEKTVFNVSKELGIDNPLAPGDRYPNHKFLGTVKDGHPRILFSPAAGFLILRARYSTDANYRKLVDRLSKGQDLYASTVAWVCKGDKRAGIRAIELLSKKTIKEPTDSGDYKDALNMALIYDLVAPVPGADEGQKKVVIEKLANFVRHGLNILDGNSASLWHGRFQLSMTVLVAALVVDGPLKGLNNLRRRAQAHFLDSLKAISLTEGWPEGYNYWINNRAFTFGVACAAHINAVSSLRLREQILKTIDRVGTWMISGTEPIGRFTLFGDTGPRVDLKDETQRVIDLFALLTGDEKFKLFSRYISGLHRRAGYYRPYRWLIPLLRGRPELDHGSSQRLTDLTVFDGKLPTSSIFGRDALGQVFIRSDWGKDATFISFISGAIFTHHQHYQAGHFTITKKTPLAITSGSYGKYFKDHRLNYYIRSVAGNCLLILRPGEKVHPNRFFEPNVADGGQRITLPTGSAIVSLEHWKANLNRGQHLEGGKVIAFDNSDPRYVYVASDLTPAYNNTRFDDNGGNGKVKLVTRQLVYLRNDDILLVFDHVISTRPTYTKKWLLHSWVKPKTETKRVLIGTKSNGIMESHDSEASINMSEASLFIQRLLPKDAILRKVGGPDYKYYVEVDGDDSDLDGKNMVEGAVERPWFDYGLWRLEIQPKGHRLEDHFLMALAPRSGDERDSPKCRLIEATGASVVETPTFVVIFNDLYDTFSKVNYVVKGEETTKIHLIVGLPWKTKVHINFGEKSLSLHPNRERTLAFIPPKASTSIKITPSRSP